MVKFANFTGDRISTGEVHHAISDLCIIIQTFFYFPLQKHDPHKYPMIERDGYIMHPRNPSFVHDLSDPVLVHVNTAEVMIRRGFRSHQDFPFIENIVELNYIENKTLENQFEVKLMSGHFVVVEDTFEL